MGKKKKYRDLIKSEIKELQQEEQRLHKRRRAIMAACQHRDGKEFTVEYEGKGKVRCRYCNSRFSLNTIDLDELRKATKLINSAIQQVRMIADPDEDSDAIARLGKLSADVLAVNDIYQRHLERYSKAHNHGKDKKKKNSDDDFGGYNGVIEVMENAIPKKKKNKKK